MRFSISVLIAATGLSGAFASPTVSARQAPGNFDTFSDPGCSMGRTVVETDREGPPTGRLEPGVVSIVSHLDPNCALFFSFEGPYRPPYLVVDGNSAQECIILETSSENLYWTYSCD